MTVDRPDPDNLDHYAVLGVDPSASPGEVKRAYRKRAAKFHPDVNPDDAEAPAILRRINRAYTVLSDPYQRDRYHRLRGFPPPGHAAPSTPPSPRPAAAPTPAHVRETKRKQAYAAEVARRAQRAGVDNSEAHAVMMEQIVSAMAAAQQPPDRSWLHRAAIGLCVILLLVVALWLSRL